MRKKVFFVAAIASALLASSAFAGFVVTGVRTPDAVPGRDQIDLFGLNTGGGSGTQLKSLARFRVELTGGSKLFLRVVDLTDSTGVGGPDGVPDTYLPFNSRNADIDVPFFPAVPQSPGFSQLRVSTTLSANVYLGGETHIQPNPYTDGVSSFQLDLIANTGTTQANTGLGFRFARLYVTSGADGDISGILGGDIGSQNPFGPIRISSFTTTPEPTSLAAMILGGALGLVRRRQAI